MYISLYRRRTEDAASTAREGWAISAAEHANCAMTKDCGVYICVCSITANCVVVMGGVAVGLWLTRGSG